MQIGIMLGASGNRETIDDMVALARTVEAKGFASLWMANIFSFDAINVLSIIGRETNRIRFGTAVTPTYPRHPSAMAQQALTAAAATSNRFTLGIGVSHKVVSENMLGFSYDRPARHMREYLTVLNALLAGETVQHSGEAYQIHGLKLDVPGAEDVPVYLAALGPAMLKVAGELGHGTITWMVGPKTMAGHIVPGIVSAAEAAGRSAPAIVGSVPVILTNRPDEARERIAQGLAGYGNLPSYRGMLDREGVAGPADIAIAGDENGIRGQIERFRDAGVTEFNASIMDVEDGAFERTLDYLASYS